MWKKGKKTKTKITRKTITQIKQIEVKPRRRLTSQAETYQPRPREHELPRPHGLLAAFKMAAWRRSWQLSRSCDHELANHKSRCHFETIKISNIFGDTWPAVCRVFSAPPFSTPRRARGRGWTSRTTLYAVLDDCCTLTFRQINESIQSNLLYTVCSCLVTLSSVLFSGNSSSNAS